MGESSLAQAGGSTESLVARTPEEERRHRPPTEGFRKYQAEAGAASASTQYWTGVPGAPSPALPVPGQPP
eukprot:1790805-Lingulodinium_polyedra.AAC.1